MVHPVRQLPGLELGAQPVHVSQDLAAERPALRLFRRVGAQQVGQLVLLPLGLLQVIVKHLHQRLSREATGAAGTAGPPDLPEPPGPPEATGAGQASKPTPGQTSEASPAGQTGMTGVSPDTGSASRSWP